MNIYGLTCVSSAVKDSNASIFGFFRVSLSHEPSGGVGGGIDSLPYSVGKLFPSRSDREIIGSDHLVVALW